MLDSQSYRIQRVIDDISDLRLECDWVNDQTITSFKSILEKGDSDFLYLELLWSIGKELSPYYDIEWPVYDKIEKNGEFSKTLKESMDKLIKACDYKSMSSLFTVEEEQQQQTFEKNLELLEFLFIQLQLIQLDLFNKEILIPSESKTTIRESNESNSMDIDQDEDDVLIGQIQKLSDIFSVEYSNSSHNTFGQTLATMYNKITDMISALPEGVAISSPFFNDTVFTAEQQAEIQELSDRLYQDYSKRSLVLTKRLDVTVESLLWSEKVADKVDEIKRSVLYLKSLIEPITNYTYFDLYNTHRDLLTIIKTSTQSKSTDKLTNVVLVGKVPDRGGRTTDRKAPMPSFHKRVEIDNIGKKHFKKKK
ncbi:hypothetical protein CYY_003309 [Polysphondylium violaceum]|uniref:Uncharacterized protein n=1 Tax=Polysphondylium violaceum TaxID=133409 RepID=A0A8J4PWY0_9MYCE|nr:hypothetical protein CYY_003309 [Polysphondylium violaceum]